MLVTLQPGNYTIQVRSVGGEVGTALVEMYDVSSPQASLSVPVGSRGVDAAASGVNAAKLLFHLPLASNLDDASSRRLPVVSRGVTFHDGAAWFDGNESLLAVPHQSLNRRAFAVAMWVKIESDYPTLGLVEQRSENRRNQHLHLMIRDAAPYLGFYVNDLRAKTPVTRSSGWTHLVFQYAGGRQELWVNGLRVGQRRAGPFTGTNGQFIIGRTPRWTNVPARDFQGGMRDLRVYERALDAGEIEALARIQFSKVGRRSAARIG